MLQGANDRLSRSSSQTDQSDQSSSVCLRNQSSCSSLTSGIGQSDQSICTDRVLGDRKDQPETQSPTILKQQQQFPNVPLIDKTDAQKVPTIESDQAVTPTSKDGSDSTPNNLKLDLKNFVDIIFTDSQSISLEKKAEFGQLMQNPDARLLFAKSVDDYRVNSKRVSELTFYSLAQYFSIVLLECLLAEDFRPAKIIMNMMFTYYFEQNYDKIPPRDRPQSRQQQSSQVVCSTANSNNESATNDSESDGQPKTIKTYLYTLLKEQQIFKSIRFWTSAFYESVIIERSNHPVFVDMLRGKSNEKRDEEMDCSKNITFGLLGSFIHNMCLLELSHEFCQEFLDKHSTIAGLSEDQLDMLRSNLESMFSEASEGYRSPISGATASERLSMFLQKWSNKLNQVTNNNSATA